MSSDWLHSYKIGAKKVTPLVFSASFFGLIFGFTGASGDLPLPIVSSMSFIIFAGSAQFITLVLIIENQAISAIIIAAIILNLRHLLYGGVLHDILQFTGLKKIIPAYFLTDEAFLVTSLIHKEMEEGSYHPDWVLIGAGTVLWFFWNLTTLVGYGLYTLSSDILTLPDNFVISASFVGFLVEQFVKYPRDRIIIAVTTVMALMLGMIMETSFLLIVIMVGGAIFAMVQQALQGVDHV